MCNHCKNYPRGLTLSDNTALFLDFDGCLCDSYVECFSMGWYAYNILYRKSDPGCMNIADKGRFRELRPMVRNSEDNVVIQHILHSGKAVGSQADFDAVCGELGPDVLAELRTCFYDTREFFLLNYRDFWLGLNTLFQPLEGPLRKSSNNPAVFILSTKRPDFIDEILKFNGISWPFDRILEARGRSKEEIILDSIQRVNKERAVFVDDQIDHLRSDGAGRITNYLAEWGYVSEDAKTDFSVPHMTLQECSKLIGEYA